MPYYWAGLKAYDLLAGTSGLSWSRFISASETLRLFPQLAPRGAQGETLKGAVRTDAPRACSRIGVWARPGLWGVSPLWGQFVTTTGTVARRR